MVLFGSIKAIRVTEIIKEYVQRKNKDRTKNHKPMKMIKSQGIGRRPIGGERKKKGDTPPWSEITKLREF